MTVPLLNRAKAALKDWSPAHVLLDLLGTSAITTPVSWIADMPWYLTVVFIISVFGTGLVGIKLYRDGKKEEAQKALKKIREKAHLRRDILIRLQADMKLIKDNDPDRIPKLELWMPRFVETIRELYGNEAADRYDPNNIDHLAQMRALAFMTAKLATIHEHCQDD